MYTPGTCVCPFVLGIDGKLPSVPVCVSVTEECHVRARCVHVLVRIRVMSVFLEQPQKVKGLFNVH